jgi:hypothetical protein
MTPSTCCCLEIISALRADAPNHEFLRVRRPLENIRIVAVEAALQFYHAYRTRPQPDNVAMPVGFARRVLILNETLVLHVVQHVTAKSPLVAHARGELPANPFNRATKNVAVVKLLFAQTVRAKLVSVGFSGLRSNTG